MARPKGFKLSKEQKERMQAGRRAAKEKALEGILPKQEKVRKERGMKEKTVEVEIVGYAVDKGDHFPYPIFSSERQAFKGRLFRTMKEARESV